MSKAHEDAEKARGQRFARKLYKLMLAKGLSHVKLGALATPFMTDGRAVSKSNVGAYLRGRMPRAIVLDALAKALGTTAEDLAGPGLGVAAPEVKSELAASTVRLDVGPETTLVSFHHRLPTDLAFQIAALVNAHLART